MQNARERQRLQTSLTPPSGLLLQTSGLVHYSARMTNTCKYSGSSRIKSHDIPVCGLVPFALTPAYCVCVCAPCQYASTGNQKCCNRYSYYYLYSIIAWSRVDFRIHWQWVLWLMVLHPCDECFRRGHVLLRFRRWGVALSQRQLEARFNFEPQLWSKNRST